MRGGGAPPPSSMDAPPERGGTHGGALLILSAFNIYLLAFPFLRQSTFYIALHCTHKSLKLED